VRKEAEQHLRLRLQVKTVGAKARDNVRREEEVMHSRYQQLLITRYNVVFEAAVQAGVDPFSPDWMQHRDMLFRRYCIASVRHQTHQDFDWFILFHPETPREYFDFLGGIGIAIFARTTEEAIMTIQNEYIRSDIVVASRIDNDDAIAPEFMRRVRDTFDAAVRTGFSDGQDFLISFRNGIVAHVPSQRWRPRSAISAPFLTLVEHLPTGKNWRSPLGMSHNEAPNLFPMMSMDNKTPMWACIVHEQNISNQDLWESSSKADRNLRSFPRRFPRYRRWRAGFYAIGRHILHFFRQIAQRGGGDP
jgi:Putative rhamnosyl transferase